MVTYIIKKTVTYEIVKECDIDESKYIGEYDISRECINRLADEYTEPKIVKDTYEIKRKG